MYTAAGCVLGHNFPHLSEIQRGKGNCSFCRNAPALDWRVFLICAVIFIGLVAVTRYVSLGSMAAYVGALICFIAFGAAGSYGMDPSHVVEMNVIMALMTALAIYRHRANISRLMNGTENKLGAKKKDEVMDLAKISVMGTGSWGTALAILLYNNGHQVMLWSAHPEKAVSLNETREDSGKLPG